MNNDKITIIYIFCLFLFSFTLSGVCICFMTRRRDRIINMRVLPYDETLVVNPMRVTKVMRLI
jgi:hypothetical protein